MHKTDDKPQPVFFTTNATAAVPLNGTVAPFGGIVFDTPVTHKYCLTCGCAARMDATLCTAHKRRNGRLTEELCGGQLAQAIAATAIPFSGNAVQNFQPLFNCQYCGGSYAHGPERLCPLVASIEYHEGGTVKKVTLK